MTRYNSSSYATTAVNYARDEFTMISGGVNTAAALTFRGVLNFIQ